MQCIAPGYSRFRWEREVPAGVMDVGVLLQAS